MLSSRLFWKIFAAYAALTVLSAACLVAILSGRHRTIIHGHLEQRLRDSAVALAHHFQGAFDSPESAELQQAVREISRNTDTRLTLVDDAGVVLADSEEGPQSMDNHRNREELLAAREQGYGVAQRTSPTLGIPMMYYAVRVGDPSHPRGFVRVAMSMESVLAEVAAVLRLIWGTAAAVSLIALTLTYVILLRVIQPLETLTKAAESIAGGDLEQRVEISSRDELGRLASAFNAMSRQLALRIDELRRLENLRREFVSNVSHELKTPLTSIQAYTETLLGGAIDDNEHNQIFLERIAEQAERLHALILDLLRLARIESGRDTFEVDAVSLDEAIEMCIEQHAAIAESKQVAIKTEPAKSHVSVLAEHEGLRTILDNLVDNAINYTPAGGRVTVRWRANASMAVIDVADTGVGIETQHLARIFERFYRVDKARSRELGGTGLGLSIVKHLVQVFDGSISVESEPGSGSTFSVKLPLAR